MAGSGAAERQDTSGRIAVEDIGVVRCPSLCVEQPAIGRLFTAEEERQRKLNQEDADAGGNGPKEVSIWCPQEPEVKIVDLGEDERNRDECLVLNINAPNVNSRLVLFCNTGQSGGGGGGGGGGAQWEDTTS